MLNQLGVVLGIFVAQSAGVALAGKATKRNGASNSAWRFVPMISSCVSVGQLLWGLLVALDGPLSIQNSGVPNAYAKAQHVRQRLWTAVPDLPVPTEAEGTHQAANDAAHSRAYVEAGANLSDHPEQEALLPSPDNDAEPPSAGPSQRITAKELFTNPRLSPGMWMIVITQIGQQLGGVNAVLYYSTGIMNGLFEGGEGADAIARTISVGITVVNALMT